MIGMAKACSGGGGLGNYVMNDEKGYELCRNNLCGESSLEIMNEMKIIQDLNQKAQNKTFSMVLSPEVSDGKKLSDKELKEMAEKFMQKLGIDTEKQQYVAFVHTEKNHKHIHIIANRVQENGKLIPDHHIGKRAQLAAHEIAKERGLVSARDKMIDNMQRIDLEKGADREIKNRILQKHQFVMSHHPKDMDTYMKQMKDLGVKVQPTINKQGKIQGHRMTDLESGKNFKASEISRQLGLKNIVEKGVPFKNPDVALTKPLQMAQNIGLNIAQKIAKTIIKQAVSQEMGY